MINVKDFIEKNSKLDTVAFQKAIDLGSKRGGETVFVPFGTYTLSTVVLRDNTNIVFEDGVKIFSANSLSDFAKDEEVSFKLYQDLSHSKYTCAMFYADNVSNVSVRGLATIDMLSMWDDTDSRSPYGDGYFRGAKVFSLRKVKGLRLYDVKILNATDISVLMGDCKDVIISRLYINSHIDGISPDGCEDVVISDCVIKTGDDALVFKTSYFDNKKHDCRRITVSNCVLSSRANAIKFGTESVGDFSHINVTNCAICNTQHSGIAIESADGANIYGINISNITMCNVANPLFIYLSDRLRAPEGTKMGSISDINISNVFADVNDKEFKSIDSWYPDIKPGSDYGKNTSYTSIIMSTSVNNKVNNVSLNNVNLRVLGGGKVVEPYLPDSKDYPESSKFVLPCYGLYAKNVSNLKLANVTYKTEKPDERPAELIEE
ncbi:MAG: hypothetical protein IJB32_06025 [Clostridia bacterium]|nr:hypothetical protein [Clostridia bacterium]